MKLFATLTMQNGPATNTQYSSTTALSFGNPRNTSSSYSIVTNLYTVMGLSIRLLASRVVSISSTYLVSTSLLAYRVLAY